MSIRSTMKAPFLCLVMIGMGCGSTDGQETSPSVTDEMGDAAVIQMDGTPQAVDGGANVPTYHGAIKGLVDKNCNQCHAEGGVAPFPLHNYESLKDKGAVSLDAMETGRMPPWQADPDCRHYRTERVVSAEDKALFRAWVEGGMPLGEDSGEPTEGPPTMELGEPDYVAKSAVPYLPDATRPDDYRCFPLDIEFAETTFVRGTAIVPDQVPIVHHVLIYLIPEADVPAMLAFDAESETPGYSCFGGPGFGELGGPLAGWAPGGMPQFTDDGYARIIPKGSRLVMQVHYNVLQTEPVEDQTEFHMYFYDEAQPNEVAARPQPHLGLAIPAGDAESVQVKEFVVRQEGLVVAAVAPHMHQLGTKIRVDLIRKDGTEECLVNIEDWDFNWQQTYEFLPGEEIVTEPGDKFRLSCTYDNSEMNQPSVNGERLAPRRITWGDGTLDEMCLNYISTVKPYVVNEGRCLGLDSCRAQCENPNSFQCVNTCLAEDATCGECVLGKLIGGDGCGLTHCLSEFLGVRDCYQDCFIESVSTGNVTACMEDVCPSEYGLLDACMTPQIEAGTCDEAFSACQ